MAKKRIMGLGCGVWAPQWPRAWGGRTLVRAVQRLRVLDRSPHPAARARSGADGQPGGGGAQPAAAQPTPATQRLASVQWKAGEQCLRVSCSQYTTHRLSESVSHILFCVRKGLAHSRYKTCCFPGLQSCPNGVGFEGCPRPAGERPAQERNWVRDPPPQLKKDRTAASLRRWPRDYIECQ